MLQRSARIWLVVAFFLLILASSMSAENVLASEKTVKPVVENGRLDLSEWDFERSGTVKLDGDWDFYWKQLLLPGDFFGKDIIEGGSRIKLPISWNSLNIDGYKPGSQGYATYRLVLKLPNDNNPYALRMPPVYTSFKIWINGRAVHTEGQVGTTALTVIRSTKPVIIPFISGTPETEIIIQSANFGYKWAGIWGTPAIGFAQDIHLAQVTEVSKEMFLIGCLFIMGVYHLCLFALRPKDRSPLYLGLFCFLVDVGSLVNGEMLIYHFYPALPWATSMRIAYFCIYMGTSVFSLYLYSLFPKEVKKQFIAAVLLVSLLSTAVLLPDSIFMNGFIQYYEMLIIAIGAYLCWAVFRALKKNRESAALVLAGLLILYTALLFDIGYALGLSDIGGYILPVGLLVFIFIQSFILSTKSNQTIQKMEELAEQLTHLNTTLEDKVTERTEQLLRSQEQLQEANLTLQALSNQDGLTSLYNRRFFDMALQREWQTSQTEGKLIAAIVADIDYFKKYNDNEGHLAGDECLKKVAAVLQSILPNGWSIAARYGGEEFVLLLPEIEPEEVYHVAEIAVKRVAELKIPHHTSEIAPIVTISLGAAVIHPHEGSNPLDLIKKADNALYQAKRNGRNRFEKDINL